MDAANSVSWTEEERAWVARDLALRAQATELATELGRDPHDVYKTLRHLAKTPSERLALGLRHGRLARPQRP